MWFKDQLKRLRPPLAAFVERCWLLVATGIGRIASSNPDRWSSPGNHRVLVVAPHPDDEVIGCAGTLIRHLAAGDDVCVAYATDGRQSRALGLGPYEMARRRRAEAEQSCRLLGITNLVWFDLEEGNWTREEAVERFDQLLQERRPDVIYAPSLIDFHPEHYKVAHALAGSFNQLDDSDSGFTVRIYPVQVPLTPVLSNLIFGTAESASLRRQALDAYASQTGSITPALRLHRYNQALYRTTGAVEEFWEVSPRTYSRLHLSQSRLWSSRAFRGIRYWPWTDPLAYLKGIRERHRLRRESAGEN